MATKKASYEAPTPATDKKKALQTAISQIEKNFGKGTVISGTGSSEMDIAASVFIKPHIIAIQYFAVIGCGCAVSTVIGMTCQDFCVFLTLLIIADAGTNLYYENNCNNYSN